jgi:hypothetical protein
MTALKIGTNFFPDLDLHRQCRVDKQVLNEQSFNRQIKPFRNYTAKSLTSERV